MPLPTSLHPRTSNLNQRQEWRDWSGYFGAGVYEMHHEREYWAIRNAAALIDVSPLFKYEFRGPEAENALNRILTRDVRKCRIGQVIYTPWCDDHGKLIDDGTLARLGDDHFRLTAADPSLRWFQDCAYGMDVEIRDVSTELSALALQGPNARAILQTLLPDPLSPDSHPSTTSGLRPPSAQDAITQLPQLPQLPHYPISQLPYYRLTHATLNGIPLTITRTGYTGDLGYELWFAPEHALAVWDCLMEAGEGYGIMPVGLAALDIARVEAGLILIEVDYIPAPKAFIPEQKSSPFEAGLGWAVKFTEGNDFIGRKALEAEAARPPEWALAGLEIDWLSLEEIFGEADLPPQVTGRASRSSVPVYAGHRQIGYVTSHTFSPILKKYIALATLEARFAQPGKELEMEFTVEHHRKRGRARVVGLPFYHPPHKKD